MKQKLAAIIGAVVALVALIAITIFIVTSQPASTTGTVEFLNKEAIVSLSENINFSAYNVNSVIPADDNSGQLPEKVKGDPKTAKVVIYEFADYACSHCAETNTELGRIYNEYSGKIAIVFRNYVLGFQNSVPAAVAANAASIQGYWEQYKNILFTEQAIWSRLQGSKLQDYLIKIFKEASNGAGNTDQFIEDMWSPNTTQRIAFDQAAGDFIGVSSTPYLIVDGRRVSATELPSIIESALEK